MTSAFAPLDPTGNSVSGHLLTAFVAEQSGADTFASKTHR